MAKLPVSDFVQLSKIKQELVGALPYYTVAYLAETKCISASWTIYGFNAGNCWGGPKTVVYDPLAEDCPFTDLYAVVFRLCPFITDKQFDLLERQLVKETISKEYGDYYTRASVTITKEVSFVDLASYLRKNNLWQPPQ